MGIPGDRVNYNKLETHGLVTHPVAGNHPYPYPEDPFQEEACSEEKEAHLGVPSCQGAAYRQEALGDDLRPLRTCGSGLDVKGTYHRTEEDRRMAVAHHNPWEDHRTEDRAGLDAEDRTQTHHEEDCRSRMQL